MGISGTAPIFYGEKPLALGIKTTPADKEKGTPQMASVFTTGANTNGNPKVTFYHTPSLNQPITWTPVATAAATNGFAKVDIPATGSQGFFKAIENAPPAIK